MIATIGRMTTVTSATFSRHIARGQDERKIQSCGVRIAVTQSIENRCRIKCIAKGINYPHFVRYTMMMISASTESNYDHGYKRLGCIGCPMGTPEHRAEELERYPKYKRAYIRAFERMLEERIGGGVSNGLEIRRRRPSMVHQTNAEQRFDYWINGERKRRSFDGG